MTLRFLGPARVEHHILIAYASLEMYADRIRAQPRKTRRLTQTPGDHRCSRVPKSY